METPTDVLEMFRSYQATRDPKLREELIVGHLQLVRYVAGRMLSSLHSSVEMQDLVSYGTFGLIDAIERFDPDRGIKFSTFAQYRIQGAINDEMRALAWEPRSVRSKHRKVQAAVADLERDLGRAPTQEEVATLVGITLEELEKIEQEMAATRLYSLEAPARSDDEGSASLAELIVDPDARGDLGMHIGDAAQSIALAMERLPVNDRVLLQMVYVQGYLLKDVARVLNVSVTRVSHLHTRACVTLQRTLAAQY